MGILSSSFFSGVYRIVAEIPDGKVISYGQIARMLGKPGAARQVGWAMRRCPPPLPWHRVIREDGSIAAGTHPGLQRALLEAEGIPFTPDGRILLRECRWEGPGADTL